MVPCFVNYWLMAQKVEESIKIVNNYDAVFAFLNVLPRNAVNFKNYILNTLECTDKGASILKIEFYDELSNLVTEPL